MACEYLHARQRDRLKALCKLGKLFDAQRLLEEHGTCRLRKTKKWSPLQMAVSKGFHSLVEVLLRYDHAQWDLKTCYGRALRHGRGDLATMILACPYWTDPIDPVDALTSGEVTLVRQLIGQGLDLGEGDYLSRAAIRNPRGVLKVLADLGLRVEAFEQQLHIALVSLVYADNTRLAWPLIRAGLDPRRPAPYYDDRDRLWDENETAMSFAVDARNLLFHPRREYH